MMSFKFYFLLILAFFNRPFPDSFLDFNLFYCLSWQYANIVFMLASHTTGLSTTHSPTERDKGGILLFR